MRSNLIGLGSKKLVGKDSFAQCFKEICAQKIPDFNVEILHLADPLREELNNITIPKFGIDLFNCSAKDKELCRPLMIEYARIKRIQTKGTYFTTLAEVKINELLKFRPQTIFCICDIRYSSKVSGYPEDEDTWIKKMGGIIVNVERYNLKSFLGERKVDFIETDIEDEIKHSKGIITNCNYDFVWPTTDYQELRAAFVRPFVDWFLK